MTRKKLSLPGLAGRFRVKERLLNRPKYNLSMREEMREVVDASVPVLNRQLQQMEAARADFPNKPTERDS